MKLLQQSRCYSNHAAVVNVDFDLPHRHVRRKRDTQRPPHNVFAGMHNSRPR